MSGTSIYAFDLFAIIICLFYDSAAAIPLSHLNATG